MKEWHNNFCTFMAQVTHWIKPNLRNTEHHIHHVIVINSDALFSRRTCASNPLMYLGNIKSMNQQWETRFSHLMRVYCSYVEFSMQNFYLFCTLFMNKQQKHFFGERNRRWMNFHNIQKTEFNRGSSQSVFQFFCV